MVPSDSLGFICRETLEDITPLPHFGEEEI